MAVSNIDLGNGATIAFGTSGHTFQVESISFSGYERAMIPTSHLATTGAMTKLASDIYDPGTMTVRVQFAPSVAMPVTVQAPETATVTFPISVTGNTTNATLAASGNISGVTPPTLENDVLQTVDIVFSFDGITDPAFTVESV